MRKSVFAAVFAAVLAAMAMTQGCTGNSAAPAARVPKTGAAGDTTGVNLPKPRFTVNGGCTVTDNLTGLMWLKDANLAKTVGYDPDSKGDGRVKWAEADALVTALNAGAYTANNCGYTDWRLPNVRELQSLIHYGYKPALSNTAGTAKWSEGDPFTNVQGSYWSATPDVGNPLNAWFVNLYAGGVIIDIRTSSTKYVLPVR